MNIQQHERIARIKQFSRYLYLCLSAARYVLWGTWIIGLVVIFTATKGNLTIGSSSFEGVELTYLHRMGFAVFASVCFFLILKVVLHFRALIQFFSVGDIFNKAAIDHARKALLYGVIIYGVCLSVTFMSWVFEIVRNYPSSIHLDGNFIVGLIFFGLMYVLLWALEIGCDLNEESELTI